MNDLFDFRHERHKAGESICLNCRYGIVLLGFAESESWAICDFVNPAFLVPFPVRQCTSFEDKRVAKFYELEKIALMVEPNNSGRKAGFAVTESSVEAISEKTVVLPLEDAGKR